MSSCRLISPIPGMLRVKLCEVVSSFHVFASFSVSLRNEQIFLPKLISNTIWMLIVISGNPNKRKLESKSYPTWTTPLNTIHIMMNYGECVLKILIVVDVLLLKFLLENIPYQISYFQVTNSHPLYISLASP